MNVWRYSALSVALTLLVACAVAPVSHDVAPAEPVAGAVCQAYVQAWVTHFRAHVSGSKLDVAQSRLQQAQARLVTDGIGEDECDRPDCMVVPLAGGRLDSYCGYRRPDPTGRELYRWVSYR